MSEETQVQNSNTNNGVEKEEKTYGKGPAIAAFVLSIFALLYISTAIDARVSLLYVNVGTGLMQKLMGYVENYLNDLEIMQIIQKVLGLVFGGEEGMSLTQQLLWMEVFINAVSAILFASISALLLIFAWMGVAKNAKLNVPAKAITGFTVVATLFSALGIVGGIIVLTI